MQRFRRITPLAAFLIAVSASLAHGHFVWLEPIAGEPARIEVHFGEDAESGDASLLDKIAGITVWQFTPDGKTHALKAQSSNDSLWFAAQNQKGARESVYIASKDYGVLNRGDSVFRLKYYAKTAFDQASLARIETRKKLPLDLTAVNEAGKWIVTVCWQGEPVADAEVVAAGAGLESIKQQTDASGKVSLKTTEPGMISIRARFIEEVAGEVDGEKFAATRHYSTLAFDTATDAKKQPPELSSLPHAVTSFGAAGVGDNVYVYGGHTGTAHEYSTAGQTGDLWKLSLKGNSKWEKCGDSGPKLQGLALVAYQDRLIRLGGFTAKNADGEEHDLWSQASAASFDTKTKKWTALPDLPEPRSSFDAVVAGDWVYVVGGWQLRGDDDSVWHQTAWKLNLAADKPEWVALPKPDFQRRAVAAGEVDGKIYVIGGMQSEGGPTRRVDVFDVETNTWKQGPDLVGEKGLTGFGASAFRVGDQLIVTTIDGTMQTPAASGKEWQVIKQLTTSRFFHRMLPWGDNAVLMIAGADMRIGKFDDLEIVELP